VTNDPRYRGSALQRPQFDAVPGNKENTMANLRGLWLLALTGTLFATQDALAQGGGMMPTREEIMEKVNQVIEAAEEDTVTVPEDAEEGEAFCRITYKRIPTNPARIGEILGEQYGNQAPAGVNLDQLANQYAPQITEILNEHLREFGTIEVFIPLKVKGRSRRLPVGTYTFGIEFDGERPVALVIRGEDLPNDGQDVPLRLQTRSVDPQDEIQIAFEEPRRQREGREEFEIRLAFMRYLAKTARKLERDQDAEEEDEEDDD
jgi:hypothetical protein